MLAAGTAGCTFEGITQLPAEKSKRGKHPPCFTIREILILVATVKEAQRVAYIERVFGWFFEGTRTEATVVSAAAGVVIGLAVSDAPAWLQVPGGILLIALVCVTFVIKRQLAPLHREYLECLALLERLGEFEHELRARLAAEGFPDCQTIRPGPVLPWSRRRWEKYGGKVVADMLNEEVRRRAVDCQPVERADAAVGVDRVVEALGHDDPSEAIGTYLVDRLAWLPTDVYESNDRVRQIVKAWLDRASRAKKAADRGSTAWKEILVERPLVDPADLGARSTDGPTA